MANAIDLTTSAQLASVLGVDSGTAILPTLVTMASRAIATYLGYEIHSQTSRTEQVVPSGAYAFMKAGVVTSISSVTAQGATLSSSTYRIDDQTRGRIVFDSPPSSGAMTVGDVSPTVTERTNAGASNGVVVTFSSGYVTPGQNAVNSGTYPTVTLPEDIQWACLEVAVAAYRRLGRDGDVASLGVGSGSISYESKNAIPATARQLLARYRKSWGP